MRKNPWMGIGWVLLAAAAALAQFAGSDAAEDAKWEEYLRTAAFTGEEQFSGGEAVTRPYKIFLEKDGLRRYGIWKNPEGRMGGFLENWKWEIAAYRLDRLLGLNMVPPTVERRRNGVLGSLQLGVEHWMTLKIKNEKKIPVPPGLKTVLYNRATYLHRAFDNLIANEDRHANNILVAADWRLYLIDHSRSFRTSRKFTEKLIYTDKHREGPKEMLALPRVFVDKLKGLTAESIKAAVGDTLTDEEIAAVLARRDLVLAEIDRLIKKNGEVATLY